MTVRIGLMGFGRIGRNIFRQVHSRDDIEIAVISDLGAPGILAYLLEFDTLYGRFPGEVRLEDGHLIAGRQRPRLVHGGEPSLMPWGTFEVDVVVEATHAFRSREKLEGHLEAGAGRVVLATPAVDSIDRTVIHGLNHTDLAPGDRIVSCASATTQALGLVVKILDDAIGVKRAMMTTVHAWSSDQNLADTVAPNPRRSRSAAENLIPNQTWSPGVIASLMPRLKGKIDGIAINVPVSNGSNLDLVVQLEGAPGVDAINSVFRDAAAGDCAGYLACSEEPLVSCDVIGDAHSAIIDSLATIAMPGGLAKVIAWYDNGWGYAARIIETIMAMASMPGREAAR